MCFIISLSILFFFKQKTAYEMRISDWSSDVCSSDLPLGGTGPRSIWRERIHAAALCPHADRLPRKLRTEQATAGLRVPGENARCQRPTQRSARLCLQVLRSSRNFWTTGGLSTRRPNATSQLGIASCRGTVCQYV